MRSIQLISAFVFAWCLPAKALEIVDYDPVKHKRFSSGYSSNPVSSATPNTSPNFIGAGHDWSGVIWNSANRRQSYVLVSRKHYLLANHFAEGTNFQFHSHLTGLGNASRQNFTALAGTDIGIGRLNNLLPAAAGLATYPLLDLPTPNHYVGLDLFVYGHEARIGKSKIMAVYPDGYAPSLGKYHFTSEPPQNRSDFITFESQDSGSPDFIVFEGNLTLVGNNYFSLQNSNKEYAGGGHNFFALPEPVAGINNILAEEGFALRFLTQPAKQYSPSGSPTNRSDFGQNGNWSPNGVPTATQTIGFDGGANTKTINLNADRSIRGIRFTGSAGQTGFSFSAGHTLTTNYVGIRNDAPATQTFECPMALSGHQHWTAAAGNLQFNGAIQLNAHYLNTGGIHSILFSSPLSGNGGLSIQQGTSILNTNAAYSGNTYLYGGTLELTSNGQLPAASPIIFAAGNLRINGATASTGPIRLQDHSTILFQPTSGNIHFAASETETWRAGRTLQIEGFNPASHSLRIGTSFAGISPAKRTMISFSGIPAFHAGDGFHRPASPFEQWLLQQFPDQAGNPDTMTTLWGPNANPSKDGINNLVKYALNLNPHIASIQQLPSASRDNEGRLTMTVTKNSAASDLVYFVEVSSNLLTWHSGPGHTETLVDDSEQLIVRDTLSSTDTPRRFMRLQVNFAE